MPPQPLEGFATVGPSPCVHHQFEQQQQQQQQLMMSALQPVVEAGPRPGYIPLTTMIEFIIQRTYHDLTVLAELLPRKTDMERKIEIYNFTARTKHLFIRLLALVKWAGSSSKVEKSCDIMTFLDKQSMLFVDTADALSRMSRDMLVNACLPNFQIPEAIEVLTTGTYSRLPTCIKDRIVPIEPLIGPVRKTTLLRLNQIIQHRLVTGHQLPQQMRNFKIANGRVQFRVEHEFEVGLTLMGDAANIPWRMLEIEILVEDNETGTSNTALVNNMQLGFMHQLVQARLIDSSNPVQEVYNCLHYFCQSLQLEVLFGQTMHLKQHRLNDSVQVEEYVRGSKLTVSYWRDLSASHRSAYDQRADCGYRLTVQTDPNDSARPLSVCHLPSIGNRESAEMADRAVRTDRLSMERLLVHTVYIRSLARLSDMRAEFQTFLKEAECHLRGTPAILTVPILLPCHNAEHLHISVDTHTGQLRCCVPKHPVCPLTFDLQAAMNGDNSRLPALVRELRFWLARRRCERSLQKQLVVVREHLPLLLDCDTPAEYAAIAKSGRNKMFVQYNQLPDMIVVVELHECPERFGEMLYKCYQAFVEAVPVSEALASTTTTAMATTNSTSSASTTAKPAGMTVVDDVMTLSATIQTPQYNSLPKTFLRLRLLTEFDMFAMTHGPSSALFTPSPAKRPRLGHDADVDATLDHHSSDAYLVPDLVHAIAMFADKLPFVELASELSLRGIPNGGVQSDIDSSFVCVKIFSLPLPSGMAVAPSMATLACVSAVQWAALQERLLAVTVREQLSKNLHTRSWSVETVFSGSPLSGVGKQHPHVHVRRRYSVQHQYSAMQPVDTVDALLRDWTRIVYLHGLVYDFAEYLRTDIGHQQRIHSLCTIRSFTYSQLLIGYGPQHESLVTVRWCPQRRAFRLCFARLNASAPNPHSLVTAELEAQLNSQHCLARLVYLLHETYRPLSAVGRLEVIPHYGLPRPTVPVLSFCLLPQTPTLIRIAYQAMYCLELRILGDGIVSLRDAAQRGEKSTKTPSVDDFTATQGLLGFLRKYTSSASTAHASVFLRRLQGEEENPVSPTAHNESTAEHLTAATLTVPSSTLPPLSISLSYANGTHGKISGNTGAGGPHSPNAAAVTGLRFPASVTPPPTPASPLAVVNHTITSPSSQHPNNCSTVTSNGVPSPVHLQQQQQQQRPGSAPIHSPQSVTLVNNEQSSPFSALSPSAARTVSPHPAATVPTTAATAPPVIAGAAAPSTRLPIRVARACAGAVQTALTNEALEMLLQPGAHPEPLVPGPPLCPLERFLGSVNLRRNLQRYINSEDFLTPIDCTTPGMVVFRIDNLQFHVSLNTVHMQSLHLKVRQVEVPAKPTATGTTQTSSPPAGQTTPVHHWSALDLLTLERFFELRVASPPYRPNTLFGFCRMLNVPALVLRDLLQIIRVEMQPEMAAEAMPGLHWNVQLLMRVPPSAPVIVPTGNAAVHMIRHKILFFLQITRKPTDSNAVTSASPPSTPHEASGTATVGMTTDSAVESHTELPSLVIPMVYDVNANITQLAERRDATGTIASSATNTASLLLRRFAELHKANAAATGECTIFPAIRELLTNYVMPGAENGGLQQQHVNQMATPAAETTDDPTQQHVVPSQSITVVGNAASNGRSHVKAAEVSGTSGLQAQQPQPPQTIVYTGAN